jgi:hypothetical protein
MQAQKAEGKIFFFFFVDELGSSGSAWAKILVGSELWVPNN